MMGGKQNSLTRMYLAGLQGQSSVYGATIPVIYGVTKSTPMLIWLPGVWLRAGAGLGGKKSNKGTNYVDNADFLIGHNPIAGVLRFWYNNAGRGLHFVKYSHTSAPGSGGFSVTIPDAYFYFLLAVTADVDYSVTFDDFGGQGSESFSGTFEMPLWNVNYAGPDPTNQSGYRNFPAVYQWIPYSGAIVAFPPGAIVNIPNVSGGPSAASLNFYYAQLDAPTGAHVPCTSLRMTYEAQLGSGNAYGVSGEQIIYPAYAGLWSTNLDMGVSGAAPVIAHETAGSFLINPPYGDADHADMIEDIFKSGPAQAGTGAAVAYGDIHHGLGCLDFPGTIQKKFVANGVSAAGTVSFDLPNTAGNILFCVVSSVTSDITITDSAGNNWSPLVSDPTTAQVWYAIALGALTNTVTLSGGSYANVTLLEVAGLDTINAISTTSGTGGTYSASIAIDNKLGEDALILSFIMFEPGGGGGVPVTPPYHWKTIVSGVAGWGFAGISTQIDERRTKFPGTYNVSYIMPGGVAWTAVLFAMKNSQPNSFTSPLGNILDDTTMQNARAGARAYGLIGSLVMDSQKKAMDWLAEMYRVLNAAPVWSGFTLKSIAYAEQSEVGNGAIYVSPTAGGPVATLTEDDFIADESNPPVLVSRSAQVDAPNLQQIQYPLRTGAISNAADYAVSLAAQPDNGSMLLYGTRKDSPEVFQSIQSTLVARMILGIKVREANIIRNTYKFKAQAKWSLLEAMDVIVIPPESTMPSVNLPSVYPAFQNGFQP